MRTRWVGLTATMLVLVVGLLLGVTPRAQAAGNTCTWTGASDTSWATAGNWSGCGGTAPTNGDTLVFDTDILSNDAFLTNDIASLQLSSISFTGTNINSYTVVGNALSINNGITSTALAGSSLRVGVTLASDQTFSGTSLLRVGVSSADLNLGNHTLALAGGGTVDIDSPMVGSGTVALDEADTWGFFNQNSPSFTGNVVVGADTRLIFNAAQGTALGTAVVAIQNGGVLQESINASGNNYTISNSITMQGDGNGGTSGAFNVHDFAGGTSTVTLTGSITLSNSATIDLDNANVVVQSRPAGCGYSITKSGGSSGSGGSLAGNLAGTCPTSGTHTWTENTAAPSGDWQTIAGSSDGKYLVSPIYNGAIYTSNDYGATWTARTAAGTRQWVGTAVSGNGTYMAVTDYGGHVWTSNNHGITWVDQASIGNGNWQNLAISSSGARVVVSAYGGNIYTSNDYGATWTARTAAGSRNWNSIASSADGSHLVSVVEGGDIWTSSDYGATWVDRSNAGSRGWRSAASSADGSHLAVTVYGGYVWTSNDYGVTWTERTSSGYALWQGIAMSADGRHVVAVESGGDVWTSNDYGVTWVDPPGAHSWFGVFMSASGARIAATVSPGRIWTAYDPSLDPANIAAAGGGVTPPATGHGTPQRTTSVAWLGVSAAAMVGTGALLARRRYR